MPAIRVVSANPGLVRVRSEAATRFFNTGWTVEVEPVSAGNTRLSIETSGGFRAGEPIPVEVAVPEAANLFLNSSPIGRDLQVSARLSVPFELPARTVFRVTSADPSRLLVSANPAFTGTASAEIAVEPRRPGFPFEDPSVWLQALGGEGTVNVTLSAAGYPDRTVPVALAQAAIQLTSRRSTQVTPLDAPLQLSILVGASPPNQSFSSQAVRPGMRIPVTLTSSDPFVGTVPTASIELVASATERLVLFEARSPGTTIVTVSQPPGFVNQLAPRQVLITVLPARLQLQGPARAVGAGTMVSSNLRLGEGPLAAPVRVTITSTDPARLLVSSGSTPAAGSIEAILPANGNGVEVSFHGIGGDGSVPVRFSAAGANPFFADIDILPAGFSFQRVFSGSTLNVGSSDFRLLQLQLYDAVSGQLLAATPRPGLRVPVSVTSSDPQVLSVSEAVFGPNLPGNVTIRALRAGSATIRLTQPPGYQALPGTTTTLDFQVQ
ncbi:MAG: hypothetical protein K2X03_09095 [Bryobacteraceae bacterium]|nr:hypothetical protein [Bryobacteraceae bacterium]